MTMTEPTDITDHPTLVIYGVQFTQHREPAYVGHANWRDGVDPQEIRVIDLGDVSDDWLLGEPDWVLALETAHNALACAPLGERERGQLFHRFTELLKSGHNFQLPDDAIDEFRDEVLQ